MASIWLIETSKPAWFACACRISAIRTKIGEFATVTSIGTGVFLKSMRTRHGGNGYAHVPRHFLPRLVRHGLNSAAAATLLKENPARVFGEGESERAANRA